MLRSGVALVAQRDKSKKLTIYDISGIQIFCEREKLIVLCSKRFREDVLSKF